MMFRLSVFLLCLLCAPAHAEQIDEVATYIESVADVDSETAAQYLVDAAKDQGLDVWILVAIAQFESRFDHKSRGGSGERGLLQVHPSHKTSMREAGLDWNSAYDVVLFGACMLRDRLDAGKSLSQALKPWAVRKAALKLYETLPLATQTGLEAPESPESGDTGNS